MCGFGGFLAPCRSAQDFEGVLGKMASAIRHRGPDASGCWHDADAGIGLAHARLSIVDLSPAGNQPMHSQCERYVIAFNGEIYNHMALRRRLEAGDGTLSWRGHSDTETLLACFSSWGIEKTLVATVGMFSMAVWDKQESVLTLARDRFGEKPLYWGRSNQTVLFGSEVKALKAHPGFNAKVNRDALALLLRYNSIPSPYSIYQGIQKLPPGHMVQIRQGDESCNVISRAYWEFNEIVEAGLANPFGGSDVEAVSELEQRISQSVAGQMLADVPLGAFLSGGVDSSTIVALMQQQSQKPVRTFAIGFNEAGYNEAQYAKEVAAYLGTNHTELYVGTKDALSVIPDLPRIYCEPFADSSQIPTFLVSKMAKQQVTVALSGDGGDELFGGYNPYQFAPKVWRIVRRLPLQLRKLAVGLLAHGPIPNKLEKLLRVLPSADREAFYDALMSHWQEPERVVIGAGVVPTVMNSPSCWPRSDCFEHWMMAVDSKQYMSDDILTKVDRAAMANSLESRVPLLDHRVVEFAWQLPIHQKIRNGAGKWALREVLYRHVPREMIERPKKGFSIPLADWLRGPLNDWAESLLDEGRLKREGYFNAAPIRKLWIEHRNGTRDNALRLWSVLMFQAWLEHQHD